MSITEAIEPAAIHQLLGEPSRIYAAGPPALYGHRDNQIHVYHTLGLCFHEHHYTRSLTRMSCVFWPEQSATSVFWARRSGAIGGEQAMIEHWQVRREGGRRGIVSSSLSEHAITMTDFEFIEVTPGRVELGWRFDSVLPKEAVKSMSEFAFGRDFRTLFFSPRRSVAIAPFKIATTAVPWDTLFACDDYGDFADLREACRRFESELAKHGWRLPTEDEFEIAAGGELFAWGNEIPDGFPYGKHTTFTKHKSLSE